MRVVIVGAGIIGAAIAHHLARRGHQVTVIDSGLPGQGASGRSFGWLNASYFLDTAHFRLRIAGLAAWQRLGLPMVRWPGCLWWDTTDRSFYDMHQALLELNYVVRDMAGDEIAAAEPGLAAPPDRALKFQAEGVADLPAAGRALLAEAQVIAGLEVTGLTDEGGRITGVDTAQGRLAADAVVLAAGVATPGLLAPLGVALPMLDRPGVLMRTPPVPPLLCHILAAPGQELLQDTEGRIVAPTSAGHQGDTAAQIQAVPQTLAAETRDRVAALLGRDDLTWAEVVQAARPVPGDGRPVVGRAGPEGLFVAVMHSGATLAAIVGDLVATEVEGGEAPLLAPFRPARFQATA